MSTVQPEIEIVDRARHSFRYLEHGWPSELCRWHSHVEYELHLVVATRGKVFVGDYIGDFLPGALYLTGPNLPHNWITDEVWKEPVPIRDILVQFNQESIDHLALAFPEFSDLRQTLLLAQSGIEFVGFDPARAQVFMETIRDQTGAARILAFLRFLVALHDHPQKRTLSVAKLVQLKDGSKHAKIGQVVDHLIKHFAEDFSVEQAADMAGMTQQTFSRSFQTVTGHRFVEFLNRVRIGQACGMLYATDDQVTTICYQVGFQNLANFNRHFLKMKGMPPSAYRDTARRELSRTKELAE